MTLDDVHSMIFNFQKRDTEDLNVMLSLKSNFKAKYMVLGTGKSEMPNVMLIVKKWLFFRLKAAYF